MDADGRDALETEIIDVIVVLNALAFNTECSSDSLLELVRSVIGSAGKG